MTTQIDPAPTRRHLLIIFLAAILVRVLFVIFYSWTSPDEVGYDALARNLLAGNGFSTDEGPPYEPSLYRTPVYPAFLAAIYMLVGPQAIAVHIGQAFVGSATCCLVYLIARRFWPTPTAFLAALLSALHPFLARYVAVGLTETLYAFLLTSFVYLLTKALEGTSWRWAAAAGLLMGLSILCRPEAVLLSGITAAILVLHYRLQRPGWLMATAFFASTLLIVFPWPVRNYLAVGRFVLLFDRGPEYEFWLVGFPYWDVDNQRFLEGAEQVDPVVREYQDAQTTAAKVELKPKLWRAGFEHIQQFPTFYLRGRVRGLLNLWASSGDYLLGSANLSFSQALAERRYGLVLAKAFLLTLTGLAPLGLAVIGLLVNRKNLLRLWPIWLVPAYITSSRLLFTLQPRYSVAGQPFLLMFAACGLLYLWNWRQLPVRDSSPVSTVSPS